MRGLFRTSLWILASTLLSQSAISSDRPNVLFIAVDDLRTWVGHLEGHPNAQTPHIDRLAARGVSFTRAYCAAPLCNPSRVSLLTGTAPHRSGVYGNRDRFRENLPDAITLMQRFRRAGYSVRGAGKIFHGTLAHDERSWDFYYTPPRSPRPAPLNRNERLPQSAWVPWGALDCDDEAMFDGKNANWIIAELQRAHDRPFFLAYGLTKPHLPWEAPQKYFESHPLDTIELPPIKEDDLDDLPAFGQKLAREIYDPSATRDLGNPGGDHNNVVANDQWPMAVQAYLATIHFADAQIGRVLNALEESGQADKTIVILWGDHGWHLGEKQHWRKHALWDVTTRTPLIISLPGARNAGTQCHRPVSLIDMYPTLLDLCGLPKVDGLDGQSLTPLLEEPTTKWDFPVLMTYGYRNHAIQTERWRYIHYANGGEELYDHSRDPNEWNNLAPLPQHQNTIQELKRHLPESPER